MVRSQGLYFLLDSGACRSSEVLNRPMFVEDDLNHVRSEGQDLMEESIS